MNATHLRAVNIIGGLSARYGGPSYTVPRLCQALATAGIQTALFSVTCPDDRPRSSSGAGYCDRRFHWDFATVPILRNLCVSAGLARELTALAAHVDVIHNHGLWLLPNVQAEWVARRAGIPLVVTPLGMLSSEALSFSPIKKYIFSFLLQRQALRRAACIHATCEAEYIEIRDYGLTNPVAIIPNGVDVPAPCSATASSVADKREVLSLGRVHPKKGLDRLLLAWARVEAAHPRWTLRIVGPSENDHALQLQAMAARLGLVRVSIEGPLYGESKLGLYRAASIFVLPTTNENFAMTVAEALAAGIPVISTKGAPWAGLETYGCGWWIDHGVEALAATLDRAMALPPECLRQMGTKGRNWMAAEFSWEEVAAKMQGVYTWLRDHGNPPAWVRFN